MFITDNLNICFLKSYEKYYLINHNEYVKMGHIIII